MRLSTTAMVEIDASNASSIDTQESASIQVTNCATSCASMEANRALKSSNSAACFGDARVSTETSRIQDNENESVDSCRETSSIAEATMSSCNSSLPAEVSSRSAMTEEEPQQSASLEDSKLSDSLLSAAIAKANPKKQNSGDRLKRSRERNRIHARKTRQRKKEQMQSLQTRADGLKAEQIRLKQTINEKATASILLGLFSKDSKSENSEDPKIEELLRRPVDEIPDASKLPELPALILPGQHNSKKHKASEVIATDNELPNDGIDYELLGKDRSKCTPAELDQIRRERNRMHAKRTRDRKRLFMEEMAEMCNTLEEENVLLQRHLDGLNGIKSAPSDSQGTPILSAEPSNKDLPPSSKSGKASSENGVTYDQIKTLLEAAGAFSSGKRTSPVSASTSGSEGGSLSDHDDHFDCNKRQRLNEASDVSSAIVTSSVPKAITTSSAATAVGC